MYPIENKKQPPVTHNLQWLDVAYLLTTTARYTHAPKFKNYKETETIPYDRLTKHETSSRSSKYMISTLKHIPMHRLHSSLW